MGRRSALITLLFTLFLAFGALALTLARGTTPLLGLDLKGGFSVVLEAPAGTDPEVLDKAVEVMRRRIEALGNVQEPEIQVQGDRNVIVQLPGVTDRDRALQAVGTTGQLAFRPVLNVAPFLGVNPFFLEDLGGLEPPPTDGGTVDEEPADTEDPAPQFVIALPEGVSFCAADVDLAEQLGCVDETTGVTASDDASGEVWLLDDTGTLIYHLAEARVLGGDLANVQAEALQTGGHQGGIGIVEWVVTLDFDSEGGDKFAEVTRELAQFSIGDPRRQFAIVLDGRIQSAPQVNATVDPATGITGGSAIISIGSAEDQQSEAQDLEVVLRYGSLPTAFEQVSVESVSATLGEDSLRAGLIAGIGGLILVALAMLAYYRSLGLVNVVGLMVFGSLTYVVFAVLGSLQGVTLTLAGVAGVIVAVGITSDSYIVYYERIKEEVHKGRSLQSAIDHAFARSFRTILTADFVSFVGAALLFFLAIGSVKGFALALLVATVTDVFVAYFYTRPAVALLARSRLGDGGRLSIRGATGEAKEALAT